MTKQEEKEHYCASKRNVKTKEILSRLNKAYSETESINEATLREKSKQYFVKNVLKEEFSRRRIKK